MLNQFVNSVVEAGREWLYREKNDESQQNKSIEALCSDLLKAKGEASSAVLAFDIVKTYQNLTKEERLSFYEVLAHDFDLDIDALIESATLYKSQHSKEALRELISKSQSMRQKLFRRINQAQEGTALLVNLRAEILSELKDHPNWIVIDFDLIHLLSSWFNRGFLRIKRIDWRSPAIILEKLMKYESVHTITGWDDLHRRLADDRRCYAFFHPVLQDEPLIFVEVALVKGLATSIANILDVNASVKSVDKADTAIFYSINNCQKGLRGISFGDFLIKQVVSVLQKEIPNIKSFATLSPVPSFRKWLLKELANNTSVIIDNNATKQVLTGLIVELEQPDWQSDTQLCEKAKPILTALCAHYLSKVLRNGKPLDPVARFHLHNGAQLNQINWLGDQSKNGIDQSFGILVNYVYDVDSIERNHEDYIHHGHISVSDTVKKLSEIKP
ncbi:MAG: decarboxylase [Sulfurovum sp.]|nr:MAG: decarboxylase [Sulfurovum sp.]